MPDSLVDGGSRADRTSRPTGRRLPYVRYDGPDAGEHERDDGVMGQALLTLGAVVVGAVASVAGTVYVNRRELMRRQRVELYLRDVPTALIDVHHAATSPGYADSTRPICDHLETILRKATVASGADARHVEDVLKHARRGAKDGSDELERDEHGRVTAAAAADTMRHFELAETRLREYLDWLATKVR